MFRPTAHLAPRDQLIRIALDLLDDQHPEDLSLREVARRAGLTSGAPAHHFGNKNGLLAACAELAWQELGDRMHAADGDEGTSAASAIRAQAAAYLDFAVEHPGPYRLMTSRLVAGSERFPEVARLRNRAIGPLLARIPPDDSDPKHAWRRALAVWALLHGHVILLLDLAIPEAKVAQQGVDICDLAVVVALQRR